jgi:hypothetical protein
MSVSAGSIGKCPHCGVLQRFEQAVSLVGQGFSAFNGLSLRVRSAASGHSIDREADAVRLMASACSSCRRIVVYQLFDDGPSILVPTGASRSVPREVEEEDPDLAAEFREATAILDLSPRASAALARRCLEAILTNKAGANQWLLKDKVEFAAKKLPGHLAEQLHPVRELGNLGAHRAENAATGEVLQVEPGEAEWTLDVVEMLFDFYYVQPKRFAHLSAGLQQKIATKRK